VRATFHTSPHRAQRQYESARTTLLIVDTSVDRHTGHWVGAAAGSGPPFWMLISPPNFRNEGHATTGRPEGLRPPCELRQP